MPSRRQPLGAQRLEKKLLASVLHAASSQPRFGQSLKRAAHTRTIVLRIRRSVYASLLALDTFSWLAARGKSLRVHTAHSSPLTRGID